MPGCEISEKNLENILSPNRKWIPRITKQEKNSKVQIQKSMDENPKIQNKFKVQTG